MASHDGIAARSHVAESYSIFVEQGARARVRRGKARQDILTPSRYGASLRKQVKKQEMYVMPRIPEPRAFNIY